MDDHQSWLLRRDTAPPFHSCYADGCCPQLAAYNDNAVAMPFLSQQLGSPPTVPPTPSTDSISAMHQPSWTWREPVGGSRRVRKRITRACDRCHQVRTKCDGQQPCALCTNNKVECQYNRQQKRRGKAPRKDPINRVASQDTVDSSHCVNAVKLPSATSSPHIKKPDPVAIANVELAQHVPDTLSPSLLPPTVSSTLVPTTSNASTLEIDTTSMSFYPQHHQYDNSIYSPEYIPTFQESGHNSSSFIGESGFGCGTLWLPNQYHTPHAEQSITENQTIPGQMGSDTFQATMEPAKEVIPMGIYPANRQDVSSKSTHKENQKHHRIRKVIRRLLAE